MSERYTANAVEAQEVSPEMRYRSAADLGEIFRRLAEDGSSSVSPSPWAVPAPGTSDRSNSDGGASQKLYDSPSSEYRTRTIGDVETIYDQLHTARRLSGLRQRLSRDVLVTSNDLGIGGVRLLEKVCARRIQRAWRTYAKRQETVSHVRCTSS